MSRQTLYVETPGTILRRETGALRIERDGETVGRAPVHRLLRVMLWAGTHITNPALRMLLRGGVDVAIMARGRLLGAMRPPASGSVALLLAHLNAWHDPERCLHIARGLIDAKCAGQHELLTGARNPALSEARAALAVSRGQIDKAPDLDTLRGIEGAAARQYFAAWSHVIKTPLRFEGRSRRPATDPINAALNLGYTLLMNELRAEIEARGLEPRLGFMHQVRAGRPALALDLVEPWRAPAVDRLVLTTINRGVLKLDDFEPTPDGGVVLEGPSFARFIDAWERHMGPREAPIDDGPPSLRRRIGAWLDGFESTLLR